MAYEDLLKSVEEGAHEKEQELRKKAAAEIDSIRERAKTQSADVRQAYLDESRKSIATERNKLLYLTKAESKELLIRTRETMFDRAFGEAGTRLATLRADPGYPVIFEKLFREAAGSLGDEAFIIHIDPRDESLCRKVMAGLNVAGEIRTDLETAGGLVLSLPDDAVVISNTVESRILRAREHERQIIHTILSGG